MNKANFKLLLIVVGGVLAATAVKNKVSAVRRIVGN